jgi:hypothetical protein
MNSMRTRQLCNLGPSSLLDNLLLRLLLRNGLLLRDFSLLWRRLLLLCSRLLLGHRLLFRGGFLLGRGCRVAADGVERGGGACGGQLPGGLSEDSGGEGAEGEDGGRVAGLDEGRRASDEETTQGSHRGGHAPGSGKHRARERAEGGRGWCLEMRERAGAGAGELSREMDQRDGDCRDLVMTREGKECECAVCVGERSWLCGDCEIGWPRWTEKEKGGWASGIKVRILISAETPPRNLETLESTNQRRCAIPHATGQEDRKIRMTCRFEGELSDFSRPNTVPKQFCVHYFN